MNQAILTKPRTLLYVLVVALFSAAVLLSSCGTDPAAQAEQAPPPEDIIPDPPPMPTGAPREPTPAPPPAPSAEVGLAEASTTLASTDFEGTTDLSTWEVIDGTDVVPEPSIWEVQDGRLSQISDGYGIPAMFPTALVTGEADWSNYVVTSAVYATGNDEVGLVVRASDEGYYVFRMLPATSGGPTRILSRYDAAAVDYENLATSDGDGYELERWYTLQVAVQGDQIRAFVDGELVIETTDATLTQGRAGVYGYALGDLQFDNFAVQALPDTQ